MNTKNKVLIAAVAGVALFSFAGPVQAQYKATGDDGITASPRVRERLNEYARNHTPPAAPADLERMACAKCTDTFVSRLDLDPRGIGARTQLAKGTPTKFVAKHLCDACATKWEVTGHGRAKESVAIHTCTGCGAESLVCCNTKKGSEVVTKGMKKKFEIAPLK